MTVRIKGIVSRNNGGDGIRIEGDVAVEAEGLLLEGNGGNGVTILHKASLLQQLGLPSDTDPLALGILLRELQAIHPSNRVEHVAKSGLLRKAGGAVTGMTEFAANVATIASHPSVSQLIQALLS